MRYRNYYLLGLCAAGTVTVLPCRAQDPAAPPGDVRVEARAAQIPDVRLETTFDFAPEVRVEQQSRTARDYAADTAEAEAQARDLQRLSFSGAGQNVSIFYSPEMAKKTREIAILRQALALKLTARDLEKALPLLREMKDADRVVPVKPEQALDEEYQALLQAKPGDPIPGSSAETLRGAASGYRTRKQAIWDKMGQAIGREKANGIRAMVRSESNINWNSRSSLQGLFASPLQFAPPPSTPADPFAPPQPRNKVERAVPAKPSPLTEPDPRAPDPLPPAKAEEGDTGAAVIARPRPPQVDTTPASPRDDSAHEAPAARRQEIEARRAAARRQAVDAIRTETRSQITLRPPAKVFVTPGGGGVTLDGNGYNTLHVGYGIYGQITLSELIDLFEKKLAAMRR